MPLQRRLAVGGLDLVAGSVARDAKNFVIIELDFGHAVLPLSFLQLACPRVTISVFAPREALGSQLRASGALATRTIAGRSTRS